MKICIFSHSFPRFKGDSVTPFIKNIAEAFAEKGHKVYVLVPFDTKLETKKHDFFTLISYKYIFPDKLHLLGYSRTFNVSKRLNFTTYLIAPFMYLFGFIALLKLVIKENIEVVNAHWIIPNGFIASFVKMLIKVPYVVSIPGADIKLGGENKLFRYMVKIAITGADWVVSDSSHYINQLNKLGFFPKNVDIIRYGVNTDVFRPYIKDKTLLSFLGIKKNDKVLLGVGRMVVQKGFRYLIQAYPNVIKEFPNSKLVLVGDGYEKQILEKIVEKLNLSSKVIFVGTIPYDQLIKYYNIADVFIMPSIMDEAGNTDASPVAMMEAMSCGVPVVATRYSGNKEFFLNEKSGYLVKEKNSNQISDAIVKLFKKSANRTETQREVREVALVNFSLKFISEKYIEIFNKVIS